MKIFPRHVRSVIPNGFIFLLMFFFAFSAGCTSGKSNTPINSATYADQLSPHSEIMLKNSGNPHFYHFLLSEFNKRKGNIDQAVYHMQRSIDSDPESLFLQRELAKLYVYKNDIPQAIAIIENGLIKDPENISFLNVLAQIKLLQNKDSEVPEIFEKILSLNPDEQAIYFLLGGLYSKMDNTQKAVETFKRLTTRFPDSFSGHYYLGRLYTIQKNYTDAEKALRTAYHLNSDLIEALYGMISIFEEQNNEHKLTLLYKEILANKPEDIRASLALGDIYIRNKKTEKAELILENLGKQSLDNPDIIKYVVRYYIKKEKYNDALALLRIMLQGAPGNSDLHYFSGVCYDEIDNSKASIEQFEKIKPESKYYEKAVLISAFHHKELGNNSKAIDILEKARLAMPENTEFILYLGSFYEETEQYDKARDVYLQGIEIEKENTSLLFRLGVVYDKTGERIACIEEMKKVIVIKPEDANALNYLGYTYADLEMNLEEAERLIKKALSYKPDDGYITDSLGWVYYKKGEYKKAIETLEKAVDLVPDDPVLLEHLGDAFIKTGESEKALEFYRRSLKNKKKNTEALLIKIDELVKELH